MDVKDFIADTLIQIIAGVKQAQDYASKNGAIVNSGDDSQFKHIGNTQQIITTLHNIEFDILVTTSDNIHTKAGVQVFFPRLVEAGGVSHNESGDFTSNRVRFSVPIIFPEQK